MNKHLTSKELSSIMINKKEYALLKLLREIKYGRVVVYLKDGQPVRVEEAIKTIQL